MPDYKTLVEDQAQKLGATVIYDRKHGAEEARLDDRTIHIGPWLESAADQEDAYWAAMHEMGHIATNPPNRDSSEWFFGPSKTTVHYEALAWTWAFRNSTIKPSALARDEAVAALMTYVVDTSDPFEHLKDPEIVEILRLGRPAPHFAARLAGISPDMLNEVKIAWPSVWRKINE